jgi:DNA polymerase III subunit delta'
VWERLVGQDQAAALLRRAAERPVHAYLLAGPRGSGAPEAARCFAAALVCPDGGCGQCGVCRRVLRGRHPDVVEVEPAGTFIVVEQIEDVVRDAFTSPFEAPRKVIVVSEADRMNEPAANKVLKTLEEPPERTHFVLLSDAPDELLPTVRSRCQRIDLAALSEADVRSALAAEGVDVGVAAVAARLCAGRLDRARALAGDWAPLRRVALEVAAALDGTGSTAATGAERLQSALAGALQAMESAQKREAKALEAELAEAGYPDRLARRLRRDLEQRHQRAGRRSRTDALAEVVTALEGYFRDALVAPAGPLDPAWPAAPMPPEAALAALDACREARSVIVARTAVNEALLLEHLLLRAGSAAGSARQRHR